MEKKFIILILAAICVTQVFSAPASRTLESDKQDAQYGLVKLVSEVNILRMRAYLLVIDLNHVIKKKNAELFQNMLAAGVPLIKLDKIKADTKTKTTSLNKLYFDVMDFTNALMDQLYVMNNHITYTPVELKTDMPLLTYQLQIVEKSYDDAELLLASYISSFSASVEVELNVLPPSPEVTTSYNLLNEMDILITAGRMECEEANNLVEATSVDTLAAVNAYINNNLP